MIEPFLECMPWPAGTRITQEFGDTFSGYAHRGRDAGCPVGTPLKPGASGVVVPCTNDGGALFQEGEGQESDRGLPEAKSYESAVGRPPSTSPNVCPPSLTSSAFG